MTLRHELKAESALFYEASRPLINLNTVFRIEEGAHPSNHLLLRSYASKREEFASEVYLCHLQSNQVDYWNKDSSFTLGKVFDSNRIIKYWSNGVEQEQGSSFLFSESSGNRDAGALCREEGLFATSAQGEVTSL
mmetsp:Transcript_4996/g.8520  ORF Transcript_4996/g.8520 Transcript_4996/m.8520 type:complete len:135 (-) Transcript_4996:53-457(-)